VTRKTHEKMKTENVLLICEQCDELQRRGIVEDSN
jgi:hypothetical protein